MKSRTFFAGTAVLALATLAAAAATTDKKPTPLPKDALAVVGDTPITDAQIEERAGARLARVKAEEYAIKKEVLDEYVLQLLMEKEAAARKLSVEELRKQEIDAKIAPVTEDAKRAVYESNPGQFQGRPEAEALAQIEANLKRGREQQARRRFTEELKRKHPVRLFLSPPRFAVDTKGEPSKGPDTAPVTLVAFSDYQCPYCRRIEPTLKQLEQKYGGSIRIVFRDFPLPRIHPHAIKAAEAAECARDQGKFWEMHDVLFANQQALSPADLKRHAAALGLDAARFGTCLDSGAKAAEWEKDLRDGERHGVSGTPTVFINGRLVRGASTLQGWSEIVEEELSPPRGE